MLARARQLARVRPVTPAPMVITLKGVSASSLACRKVGSMMITVFWGSTRKQQASDLTRALMQSLVDFRTCIDMLRRAATMVSQR